MGGPLVLVMGGNTTMNTSARGSSLPTPASISAVFNETEIHSKQCMMNERPDFSTKRERWQHVGDRRLRAERKRRESLPKCRTLWVRPSKSCPRRGPPRLHPSPGPGEAESLAEHRGGEPPGPSQPGAPRLESGDRGSCRLRCTRINYPLRFQFPRGPGAQLGSGAGSSLPPGCSAETNYELATGLQGRFEALLVRQGPGPYLSGGHRALCGLSLGASAGKPVSGRVGSGGSPRPEI